jgi:exopolysaccharide biosynthesis polyprenyl glycosylphosphotransferase
VIEPAAALVERGLTPEALTDSRARRLGRDVLLRRLLGAADAFSVLVALVLAVMVDDNLDLSAERVLWGLVAIPVMTVVFKLYGLYDRDVKRISHSTVDDVPWLLHAVAVGTLLLWLYSRWTGMGKLGFEAVAVFASAAAGIATCVRVCVRAAAQRVIGPERALLVGGGAMAQALIMKLAAHPAYMVEVIGRVGNQRSDMVLRDMPSLGPLDQLEQTASRVGATRVVLADESLDDGELEMLLRRCRALELKVSILPKLSDVLGPGLETDDVEGVAVLGLNPPWLPRSSRAIKRVVDVAVASGLLILFAPVLAVLALAIKLDSRGPVLFTQERVGRKGRTFRLLKLRTMTTDAEARREELLGLSADPNWLKVENDPRVTVVGGWLRRLSLDELPQLWNVVRGEMSLVGPRPLVPHEDERVEDWARRRRLELTPGLTGYWQVLGRTRIPFEEMVKLDYLYVMNWSLWEDIRLMLRTLPVILSGEGAN